MKVSFFEDGDSGIDGLAWHNQFNVHSRFVMGIRSFLLSQCNRLIVCIKLAENHVLAYFLDQAQIMALIINIIEIIIIIVYLSNYLITDVY